ncbi:MAG TPA: hypothetical protein VGG28_24530 [Kofleriaceae bacterium]|jgi:hypothetical protein
MNRRVLLIDSDLGFRDTLTRELARYRVDVVTEANADQALALAGADAPALIVLAIEEATKKAGFRVFEKCKKGALSKVPIILVTSSVPGEAFAKHRSLKTHADDYIDKRAMTTHELVGKIDGLIALGDADDDLAIALQDDGEVPMEIADGDVVLDDAAPAATILEDEPVEQFDEHDVRTVGPNDGLSIDDVVEAETDAAFAALLGDEAPSSESDVIHDPAPMHDAVPEPVAAPTLEIVEDVIPEPIHDGRGRGTTPPPLQSGSIPGIIIDEPIVRPPHRAATADGEPAMLHSAPSVEVEAEEQLVPQVAHVMVEDLESAVDQQIPTLSAPAIPIDDDELLALDDDVPVEVEAPELEPEPIAPAPEPEPPPVMSRTATGAGSGSHPAIDLGLDVVAEDARNEQSGVFDRKALRKIGELERQIAQLKTELERARAASEAAAKGGREAQFLNLRESMLAKEKELGQVKGELATRDRDLADAREKLKVAQHAKSTLESKNSELEQRLFDDSTRSSELAASTKSAATQLEKQRQQLDRATAAQAAAETARVQLEKDLAAERATRAASASEAERALRSEREQLVAKHRAELASANAEAASALAAAKTEMAAALAAANGEHEATLDKHRNDATAARTAALAQLRDELETAHGAALSEAIEEVRNANAGEHNDAIAQLERDHSSDMVALKADQAGSIGALRRELTAELEHVRAQLDTATAAHRAELAQRDQLLAATRDQLGEDHEQELAAVRAEAEAAARSHAGAVAEHRTAIGDAERRLADALEGHRAELERARGEAGIAIERATAANEAERDRLVAAHVGATTDLREEHRNALADQSFRHEQELSKLAADREAVADAAKRAAEAHRAALAEAEARHADNLAQLGDSAGREVAEARAAALTAKRSGDDAVARANAEREAADAAHAQARSELEAKHERASALANGEFLKQKSVSDAEHGRAIAAAQADAEQARTVLLAEHGRVVRELGSERDELKKGLSSARDSLKRSESELASAVESIADRNAELRTHAAAIAERDTRIAELRREIEALEAENTNYQDQVLRAYQKIKQDEAMVTRAKKAMAIALTVLDDQGNPPST